MNALPYRRTWDPHVVIFGWWIRLIWGITFRPERVRVRKFYGHRLLSMRLWGDPNSCKTARLLGVQWRRAGS